MSDRAFRPEKHEPPSQDSAPRPQDEIGSSPKERNYIVTGIVCALIGSVIGYYSPGVLRSLGSKAQPRDPVRVDIGAYRTAWVHGTATIEQLGTPPAPCNTSEYTDWIQKKGAIRARFNELSLVVTGLVDSTVLVEGLRVTKIREGPPLHGINLVCPEGGPVEVRHLSVDLDSNVPQVKYRDDNGKETERFAFTLKKGEVEVFEILATTESTYVVWRADLLLRVNGKRVEIPIRENYVRNFLVTGLPKGQQNYQFFDTRKGWEPFGIS